MIHRTDFKGWGIRVGCAGSGPVAARGCRTRGSGNLYLVAHMLAQLRRVSGKLIGDAVLISESVIPAGAAQATFYGGCATRSGGTGLARTCRSRAVLAGIGACWIGCVLRYSPARAE